ncbi:Uncharacterized protein APZ42_016789 [Daphnia magna]|uniref:Uncharacterized protein n=1 Tax=Daphnia magna TaxID=35525 RepID=A0A165A4B2_9CRUS|nr:Uncharacterized protein APZ42_016789 [Daphnia magna]
MSLSLRPSCNLCSLKLRYSHFDLIFFFRQFYPRLGNYHVDGIPTVIRRMEM